MPSIKILSPLCLLLIFLACGGNKSPEKLFDLQLSAEKVQNGSIIDIQLKGKKDRTAEKVTFYLGEDELTSTPEGYKITAKQLGVKEIKAAFTYEGEQAEIRRNITVLAEHAPQIYTYEVINTYPHDRKAFTQGLEFHEGVLYESTGRNGESSLRKVDYESGEILENIPLDDSYFGEGITILDGKVYQLTWQSGLGFIYDLETLEREDRFSYGKSKEGWGLCNDGTVLYKSDGTDKIWILDPETLNEKGFLQTVTDKSVFNKANELEYVDGKIYANVWQKESMMIIDATTGAIEGVVNLGGLREQVTDHPKLDVLNGVAWHRERKTFFITGKYWDKLFEVCIKPRS